MCRHLFLTVFFLCTSQILFAQPALGIEANLMAGKVIKHTPKFRAPVPELSTAVELAFLKQTNGRYDWEERRHYPLWGFGSTITRYGIDSIYGLAISLYPFVQFNIVQGKRLSWTFRAGLGLGYATRYYERAPVWDTLNNAIGSAINNFSLFTTDLRYRLDEHWSLQAGLNFSHLSNGAMKQPNLGVNMGGAHIGIRYWPSSDKPGLISHTRPRLKNRFLLQARLGFAINESGNADGPIYPSYLASVFLSRRYKSRNKIFLGVDYSYHTRIYAFERNNEINVGHEREHAWKSAVFVGHEWLIGRLGFVAQVGVYIHEAALRLDPYYEKLGYNIYLVQREHGPLKELCLSMMLKTHLSNAELVEFGIGAGL